MGIEGEKMKFNIKKNSTITTLIIIFIFVFYKNFPQRLQVIVPLILGVYFVLNVSILIYQKRYWEEILRSIIFSTASIIIFIGLYNSAFKFDNSFMKITLLVCGWTFPCLAYTAVVSWKRKDDQSKYKLSLLFLAYSIFLAIFCTVIVIVK